MAGFTFLRGNLRKLLSAPLYALGSLASRLVPRRDDLWVFGCGSGVGEGALELYRLVAAARPGIRAVWLADRDGERREADRLGLRVVRRSGPLGFWTTLRARVAVVTHGFGDVNRYAVRGAFVVQLWHGIPLKRLHLDSPATFALPALPGAGVARAVLRRLYRRAYRGISLFAVASPLSGDRLRSAFGLREDQLLVSGDPRDDVLLRGTQAQRRREASGRLRALLPSVAGETPDAADSARIVLYAPTWRDGLPDPAVPTAEEWAEIDAWLAANRAILLVRPHPHGYGAYAAGLPRSGRVRMLGADRVTDVTPLLPAVDALVTDFSSIAFDYALGGGPIVFFASDLDSYLATRGLYEPFGDVAGDREVRTWRGVLDRLGEVLGSGADDARAHSRWIADRHVGPRDGRAAERVLAAVEARLTGGTPEAVPVGVAADGAAQVAGEAATASVVAVEVRGGDDPRLVVHGRGGRPEGPERVPRLELRGSRAVVGATEEPPPAGRHGGPSPDGWSVSFPLTRSRWGHDRLALPSGTYRLVSPDDPRPLAVTAPASEALLPGLAHVAVRGTARALELRVAAPLSDEERRPAWQAEAERRYRAADPAPLDAVFFESFYGRNASCNPLALDREIAARFPGTTRYWSVADRSFALPEGAVPIVEGSAEWWRVRAGARLLVVNDWLRKRYRPRGFQTVLQTWHGTPLKRIAMDRPGLRPRQALASVRESARWDLLLAQNVYSAGIFRRAYGFRGPLWVAGYPRDDRLADREAGPAVRAGLGIPADALVVLYAPTWRDDRAELVTHLDTRALAAELGPDAVVLVRGHSRTVAHSADQSADRDGVRVLDVSDHPDLPGLFLASDVLVTDYSSLMFDFSATGKPMIFHVPDLERYREDLRGFYFDLAAEAPGPLVGDRRELVEAVLRRAADRDLYASAYRAWRARFNPLDDGRASGRVVDRLVAVGAL